ncbi:MAG: multicopper oxidase domain-containing protein, partial [Lewinella sp.]|nr:multicopper oxidase domain-containing protein [Lewinella sp.]
APPSTSTSTGRASHKFEMNIEDTRITLVGNQTFHTFAFAGQVPAPLFHVGEGDLVEVTVNNLTTLPHSIHWHGILQRGTWQMDGVPDMTQLGIQPGDSFTYKFVAEPAGTMWYHCHVNVNEYVATRGMWGPYHAGEPGSEGKVIAAIEPIERLYPEHIWKEDQMVFPMVERLVPAEARRQIFAEFEEVEARNAPGTHERFHHFAARLSAAAGQ